MTGEMSDKNLPIHQRFLFLYPKRCFLIMNGEPFAGFTKKLVGVS